MILMAPRPQKHNDATFGVQGPRQWGIPETTVRSILVFVLPFGPLRAVLETLAVPSLFQEEQEVSSSPIG